MVACDLTDVACQVSNAIVGLIVPILIPIIVFLIAIFILPKAGKKGWLLALVVIFMELWYFGLIPGLPALRGLMGM